MPSSEPEDGEKDLAAGDNPNPGDELRPRRTCAAATAARALPLLLPPPPPLLLRLAGSKLVARRRGGVVAHDAMFAAVSSAALPFSEWIIVMCPRSPSRTETSPGSVHTANGSTLPAARSAPLEPSSATKQASTVGSGLPGSDLTHLYPEPLAGAEGCQCAEKRDANAGISLFFKTMAELSYGRCGCKRLTM